MRNRRVERPRTARRRSGAGWSRPTRLGGARRGAPRASRDELIRAPVLVVTSPGAAVVVSCGLVGLLSFPLVAVAFVERVLTPLTYVVLAMIAAALFLGALRKLEAPTS